MAEGQYKFSIGLDDKQLDLDIQQAKKAFDDLVKAARDAGAKIDKSFKNPFEGLTPPADLPQRTQAAAQSFNGLNMATQSLVRELPAATMGLNTFFLAVSNNLPIFADQIKAVSAANEELQAQGEPTVGVFEQIIGSLFSWQTALTLGVTALAMYGKEIGNWIAGLFRGKKTVDAAKEAQEGLNKAISEGDLGIQDEIRAYERLRREWTALNGGLKEQEQFINDNRDAFDKLGVAVNNVHDAERLFVDYTDDFLEAMRLRAEATAAEKLAVEQYEKAMRLEIGIGNDKERYDKMSDTEVYETVAMGEYQGYNNTTVESFNKEKSELGQSIAAREKAAAAIRSVADAYYDIADAKRKAASDTLKGAGITGTEGDSAAQREAEARARRIATLTKQLATDAEREATQAKIDAMAEGINKELAQIDHDYDLREQKIREREEQLREARGGYLTDQDIAAFGTLRSAAAAKRDTKTDAAWAELEEERVKLAEETEELINEEYERLNEAKEAWNEYLMEYGTFRERLLATQQYYQDKIAAAETEGERRALRAERDAILAQYEVEASGFAKELMGMTTEELNKMLESMQKLVEEKQAAFDALDSSNSQEGQDYLRIINILNAQIAELKKQIKGAGEAVATDDWAQATQVMQRISTTASTAATELSKVDESAGKLMEGIASLAGMATNLVGAIKAVKTAAKAVDTVSGTLGLISVGIQFVSGVISRIAAQQAELRATIQAFKDLNAELASMRKLSQIDSLKGTIFGDDAFGNFANNLGVMREAGKAYSESMEAVAKAEYNLRKARIENALEQAKLYDDKIAVSYYKQLLEELEASELASRGLYDALAKMEVTLNEDHSSTLAEQLPELFAEGGVTLEGLKKLQESDVWDKLSQTNRDLIEQMIVDWEVFEQSTKSVTDYLSGIFGDLGNEINDAIVDAFMNGTDAAEAFGKSATAMLENLIKQIGYTAYIAPILTDAMTKVDALNSQGLSAEEYLEQLMGIVRDTMEAAERESANLAEFYERSDRAAEKMGFDTFNRERTGTTKGIAQASQDSVDELNGRMTAVQGHTYALVQGQRQLIKDSAQALNYLAGIERNTYELHQIRSDMGAMRRDINNIATRGIVTR